MKLWKEYFSSLSSSLISPRTKALRRFQNSGLLCRAVCPFLLACAWDWAMAWRKSFDSRLSSLSE